MTAHPRIVGMLYLYFQCEHVHRTNHRKTLYGAYVKCWPHPATDFCGCGVNLPNSCKTYIMSLYFSLVQSSWLWNSGTVQNLSHQWLINPCIPVIVFIVPVLKIQTGVSEMPSGSLSISNFLTFSSFRTSFCASAPNCKQHWLPLKCIPKAETFSPEGICPVKGFFSPCALQTQNLH